MLERVRPGRVAVIAGALVAIQVVVMFLVRPVPDAVVSLLGGPAGGVDRIGGLRLRYRPPAGFDASDLDRVLGPRSSVRYDHGVFAIDLPGATEDQSGELADIIGSGGLAIREVLESDAAREIYAMLPAEQTAVQLDVDQWRPWSGGRSHEVPYLVAETPADLRRAIATATARGWHLSPGSELAFERREPSREDRIDVPTWRTYELATEVAIDGTMIANATATYDPDTNRPLVMIDLTRLGADRFCALTQRVAGRKVATLLGGRVRSAPFINDPICGGRASITMGGSDPTTEDADARALVAVLSAGTVPPGGTIEARTWSPPAEVGVQEWLGRILLGLVGGGACALVVLLVIRVAKPRWRATPPPVEGTFPWRRLAVTSLALVAVIIGRSLGVPGINEVELAHVATRGGASMLFSATSFGVTPILTAFTVVELVALAVPRLRWRRHDPVGRIRLGQAVAACAIVLSLVQGYFAATFFERLARGGAEVVMQPGWKFRLLFMLTATAATLLLGVVAGIIREHGLGNGYGVVLIAAVVVPILAQLYDDPLEFIFSLDRGHGLGVVTVIVIAIATATVLRWRITGDDREVPLRVPSSGTTPLSDAGGLVGLVVTLSGLGFGFALEDVMTWVGHLTARTWLMVGFVGAFVPVWAWVFARPALLARVALPAGCSPPARSTWLRAMGVSAVFLVACTTLRKLAILTDAHAVVFADAAFVMLATAVVLDIADDARAHRRTLAPAAVLHQIQYAGVVERVLADAEIPCHIHAGNLRTLLAFYGPWAPAIVLVPEAHAADARRRLDEVLRPATTSIPVARTHGA